MFKFRIAALGFTTLLLNACAFGPLVTHETARTVGENRHELLGGYGNVGYMVKWSYGVTKDIDLGFQIESMSIGLRGKYAFINNERGFSLAAAAGVGNSIGGSHYYGDLMTSYKAAWWEPYLNFRYVRVKTDPIEVRDKDNGPLDFTINSLEYSYGQLFFGNRFWMTENWILSVEASSIVLHSTGIKMSSVAVIGAALGYKF
jgi:hypothetical protein